MSSIVYDPSLRLIDHKLYSKVFEGMNYPVMIPQIFPETDAAWGSCQFTLRTTFVSESICEELAVIPIDLSLICNREDGEISVVFYALDEENTSSYADAHSDMGLLLECTDPTGNIVTAGTAEGSPLQIHEKGMFILYCDGLPDGNEYFFAVDTTGMRFSSGIISRCPRSTAFRWSEMIIRNDLCSAISVFCN